MSKMPKILVLIQVHHDMCALKKTLNKYAHNFLSAAIFFLMFVFFSMFGITFGAAYVLSTRATF